MVNEELAGTRRFKYRVGDAVQHYKGGIYEVCGLPDEYTIEATGQPAYAYRRLDERMKYVRCQQEFEEDERFKPYLAPTGAI